MGISFCGLYFRALRKDMLLNNNNDFKHIITVNGQFIEVAYKDKRVFELINNNWSTIDGQIIFKLANKKKSAIKIEKISGSDFIFETCNYCSKTNRSVFLLGGKEASNILSVKLLKTKYGIKISGYSPPYMSYPFSKDVAQSIKNKIVEFKPDYVFVAFGMPKQEFWIDDNKEFLKNNNIRFAIGCGGTFEFVSGNLKRAPYWIQKAGIEWLFRFIQEPKRLWKRYLIGNLKCLIIYLKKELLLI
ncbi:WecB/TagA/CpsF family glycosyltransferase [uncultured Bacteroides sp.]|uniref:WecB/TagA/CpsF family glycosyltransferase n=1 Tax=uncultured Bacteroides sp. TaxID=162156 RepID=UPI002AA8CF87|nr:WecB/TagA/CpsF family glycosyltransferase [uncultured Bacteroides sp.]